MADETGPSTQDEGRIHAQYLLRNHPGANIGTLYQNRGFWQRLLEAAASRP